MYRSTRRRDRPTSEASMSGDDKVTSSVDPEGIVESQKWAGGLKSETEEGGHGEGVEGHSSPTNRPETSLETIEDLELITDDESQGGDVEVIQDVKVTTTKELLSLPFSEIDSLRHILLKKRPIQRSVQDWKDFKVMTFTPKNTFRSEVEQSLRVEERDDGLFVGCQLPVSSRNLSRLKERIWREGGNGSDWFAHPANFVLSDPYRPYPLELCKDLEDMMDNLVSFRPAEVNQVQYFHHRQLDPYGRYELTLEIGTVRFFHHPLFSKEHVLAEKLKNAFTQYANRLEDDQSERFEQRLRALRDTVRHTKKVAESAKDKATLSQLSKRIQKYRTEMDHVRSDRDESLRLDKVTMKSVLENWTNLKKLRSEQHFTSTEVHLKILRLEVNDLRAKEHWEEEINQELIDIQDLFQANYDRQLRAYRRKLNRWSKGHRVPAEKPFEGGQKSEESSESERSMHSKPLPPLAFQEDKVRMEIRRKFVQLKRLPTEPKLTLELERHPVTLTNDLPRSNSGSVETQRRKTLEKTKVQLRVWYNMKTNFISDKRFVTSDFTVPFQIALKLPIREVAESLHLELRQDGRSLQVIQLSIPNSSKGFERSAVETVTFEGSSEESTKGHGGVGTGLKFTILEENYDGLQVRGELTLRWGWSSAADGSLMCPKGLDEVNDDENQRGRSSAVQRSTGPGPETDPNDPKAVHLQKQTFSEDSDAVELSGKVNDTQLCDWSEIEGSNRLRLLFLRDQGVPEFKNLRMIPATELEVLPDVFQEYEKRLTLEKSKSTGEGSGWKDVVDSEKFNEWDRLQPIRDLRKRLLDTFEISGKAISFEDVVIEEQIPDIGTLGLNLMSLFQPKRPLRPERKERRKLQTSLFVSTEIFLVVNIVRAINLPLRKDSQMQTLTTEALTGVSLSRKGTWATGVVKPFVEVWFQRKVSRTTSAVGPDPTWNQELQIPLTLDMEDYSESILSQLEEEIYFQVYDEAAIDLLEDERRRETDVHHRLEKRWLGYIRIPFATLYSSGRIEGTFPLHCPPILLGYESKGSQVISESYVSLFITLQPTISPTPISNELCSVTGETNEMLEHVKAWIAELKKIGRVVRPFILTPTGDTVLACRFLMQIEPPLELFGECELSLFEKMESLAHYVSLFPSLRDGSLNATAQHKLWFTPDVFVSTPGGSRDDHSILLASFFLHLGLKTHIVQGESIDGPTTHVLTSFKKSDDVGTLPKYPLLWNPYTGTHSRLTKSLNALHVWTVIGQYNIWGNLSAKQNSNELDWDFEKSKDWLPLFPKGITETKLPRLQISPVHFIDSNESEGQRLGQRIERHLRENFMKWRQSRTTWNRYSSTKLRSLLTLLEKRRVDGSPSLVQDEHLGELKDILKSFEMTGFPLHQPYSTLESVLEAVYSTGLHTIDTPDVQFALGAYAKSYPASIFSLWVYIAALHPIK